MKINVINYIHIHNKKIYLNKKDGGWGVDSMEARMETGRTIILGQKMNRPQEVARKVPALFLSAFSILFLIHSIKRN